MPLSRWWALRSVPYAVLLAVIGLTVLGTYLVIRTSRARADLRFHTAVEETSDLIEFRIHAHVETLRAGVALFAASDEVRQEEFQAFVRGLRLQERYPGIQGIGYAIRVPRTAVADPGRNLARLAFNEVRVWPPGDRDEYTSILYLEPIDHRNRGAIGYDMFTEPVRRTAMERARDSGEPTASGRVALVQEIDATSRQAGFLIYAPVYRNHAPISTVEERRAAIVGYVYAPFRIDDLLRGVVGHQRPSLLDFRLYDGEKAMPEALLHEVVRPSSSSSRNSLRTASQLDVAGRTWTVAFAAPEPFDDTPQWVAPLMLGGGLILAFALYGVTLAQFRAWETSERHAVDLRRSEEALRESEGRLRRVVDLEREARAAAQAADRAKDEFLATLSHELRTPLNAMLGWISMLRSGQVREDRRASALEVVERNARTQARLIEDLLDVSRIITGKVRLELHPLQLGPIVHTVAEALRPSADAKGVRMHYHVPGDAGAIMGDAARLQQITWNLLSNAIKFTPPGGDVHLELRNEDDQLELLVRDTGVGISAEFLPHVFERFRQADSSTTRTHSGVGLGLAIVRHLVELHGGTIAAHSEGRDRGAAFVARFPLAAREARTASLPPHTSRVALDGVRVLVVDDDRDTRDMLTEALAATGADVVTAASAEEAISWLQDRGADILVSDIGMPDIDGYALIRRVRQSPGSFAHIPAIALTAYARPEDRESAIDAGYQVHLSKPVELAALQAALASLARNAT